MSSAVHPLIIRVQKSLCAFLKKIGIMFDRDKSHFKNYSEIFA